VVYFLLAVVFVEFGWLAYSEIWGYGAKQRKIEVRGRVAEIVESMRSSNAGAQTEDSGSAWNRASSHIFTGVKLYYGPKKFYVGEVLGGAENYVSPEGTKFRGVKLRMASGSVEWKDRNAIISGDWYVESNDPAIKRGVWHEYLY
jgi:hypothetical protein